MPQFAPKVPEKASKIVYVVNRTTPHHIDDSFHTDHTFFFTIFLKQQTYKLVARHSVPCYELVDLLFLKGQIHKVMMTS